MTISGETNHGLRYSTTYSRTATGAEQDFVLEYILLEDGHRVNCGMYVGIELGHFQRLGEEERMIDVSASLFDDLLSFFVWVSRWLVWCCRPESLPGNRGQFRTGSEHMLGDWSLTRNSE